MNFYIRISCWWIRKGIFFSAQLRNMTKAGNTPEDFQILTDFF